jgi:formate dehydrogenase iron-sulfur subunit
VAKSVLVDITKCVGCGSCAVACKLWNSLKWDQSKPVNGEKAETSAENWTVVRLHQVPKEREKVWRFTKQQCLHCEEPACASACFARAIVKTEQGPVIYRASLCVGCRYCMLACPFEIPKYEWDKVFPQVHKCQMCPERIEKGESPACVAACPTGALKYGERSLLLQEARRCLNSNSNYIKHIYGEKEAGGTSWLYISDTDFAALGFRTGVTSRPLPDYTYSILKLTPAVTLGWGAVLTGLYAYNRRRKEIAGETKEKKREKR